MKHLICSFIAFVSCIAVKAQQPVSWQYSARKIAAKTYEVKITATIESSWHIYSQSTPDGGPLPTKISFSKNPLLITNGSIKEIGKLHQKYEEAFGVDVKQYAEKVEFVQVVKSKSDNIKTNISGTINYMVCTDEQCLPPATVNFSIAVGE